MFAELTERECRNAIALEYDKAVREHSPFASLHEGWAVMREEWEEAFRELSAAAGEMNAMWEHVKQDDVACSLDAARDIQAHALAAMMEAAQLAAMARKMMDHCKSQMQ